MLLLQMQDDVGGILDCIATVQHNGKLHPTSRCIPQHINSAPDDTRHQLVSIIRAARVPLPIVL